MARGAMDPVDQIAQADVNQIGRRDFPQHFVETLGGVTHVFRKMWSGLLEGLIKGLDKHTKGVQAEKQGALLLPEYFANRICEGRRWRNKTKSEFRFARGNREKLF